MNYKPTTPNQQVYGPTLRVTIAVRKDMEDVNAYYQYQYAQTVARTIIHHNTVPS